MLFLFSIFKFLKRSKNRSKSLLKRPIAFNRLLKLPLNLENSKDILKKSFLLITSSDSINEFSIFVCTLYPNNTE